MDFEKPYKGWQMLSIQDIKELINAGQGIPFAFVTKMNSKDDEIEEIVDIGYSLEKLLEMDEDEANKIIYEESIKTIDLLTLVGI